MAANGDAGKQIWATGYGQGRLFCGPTALALDGAENVSVIGDGHRRHAQLASTSDQLVNVTSAIEQRIICMQMQVDKLRHEGLPLF